MKKFKIFYTIIIFLTLMFALVRFLGPCIPICIRDAAKSGIIDGFKEYINLSIINTIYITIVLILNLVITLNKENKLNIKWLLFAIIFLELMFVPIGAELLRGGFAGVNEEGDLLYLSNIIFYIF